MPSFNRHRKTPDVVHALKQHLTVSRFRTIENHQRLIDSWVERMNNLPEGKELAQDEIAICCASLNQSIETFEALRAAGDTTIERAAFLDLLAAV